MARQQKSFKVPEDIYPLSHSHGTSEHRDKDELVKQDMLDPPSYLLRTGDNRGKALSFGVLDWNQLEKWKDCNADGNKGACCSYGSSETAASPLELDLSTGVVKRLDPDFKPQAAMVDFSLNVRNDRFSLRSREHSDAMDADHQSVSMKQTEHQASLSKNLVEKHQSNAFELSSYISQSDTLRTVECQYRRHDVEGDCSSPVNVMERNQISVEKLGLFDQNVPTVTSKKERHTSPNRRFSFSFSQMSRSFSSKESSSSVPVLSSPSHASAKSGPLAFNDSVYANHTTKTNPNGHSRTRSGTILKPKTKKNVPLQVSSKPPTMEKNQCSSRVNALLQFTLRKGINLFQFVVENNNNVLAATMKSSDSSSRSYTLYSVKEVKNKSSNWLNRHKNEDKNHHFAHTIIGEMKTVTSFTSDLTTHKSESVLFGVETNEELAAIVQTRNTSQRHDNKTTIILPSGVHTVPKDGNAPLPLIERWQTGGSCDCGGWDIGCKLRLFSNEQIKSQSLSSFQLFDQERDQPVFKMVNHDHELHSVEFGSSISLLEAFFISLAVSSYQSWCEKEETVLIGDGLLKRETSKRFASNPPVSPIGRV